MKRYVTVFITLVVFFGMSQVPIKKSDAEETVVARVNGQELFERQLKTIIDTLMPRTSFHATIRPEKRTELRSEAMELLIKQELYFQEAKKQGLSIERAELKEAVKRLKARFRSEDEFEKALARSGYTKKSYEREVERNLLINKFIEKEITQKSRVTDTELKEYYEKNKKDFLRPESMRMRHILIKVEPTATEEERQKMREKAEDVLEKARSGEDFSGLAYTYSMDEWRVKGGDLGLVHRGRLDPEFEDSAFQLDAGQLSDIIETIYGYHIMKVDEKYPPTQMTYDEVKDKLRRQREEKRRQDLDENLLKRLKENAKIEIY